MALFEDGFGNEIKREVVMEEFNNYFSFEDSARKINIHWTSNYLHKQKNVGRIDKSKILVIYDEDLAIRYPSTKGKSMFLHIDEINRFKKEEYPKIKKRKDFSKYCSYCHRLLDDCLKDICGKRKDAKIKDEARRRKNYTENA